LCERLDPNPNPQCEEDSDWFDICLRWTIADLVR
jgi:hypothetical protein